MAKKKNLFLKYLNEKFYEKYVKDMKDDEQFRRFRRYSAKFYGDEVNRQLQKFVMTFRNIMVEVTEDDKLSNKVKNYLNYLAVSNLLDYLLENLVSSNKAQQSILENLLRLLKGGERAIMLNKIFSRPTRRDNQA